MLSSKPWTDVNFVKSVAAFHIRLLDRYDIYSRSEGDFLKRMAAWRDDVRMTCSRQSASAEFVAAEQFIADFGRDRRFRIKDLAGLPDDVAVLVDRHVNRLYYDEELSRLRYRISRKANAFPSLGPRWGASFTIYKQWVTQQCWDNLGTELHETGIERLRDGKELIRLLKDLGGIVKKYAEIVPYWDNYVGLEVFGGYQALLPDSYLIKEVRDEWLAGKLPIHEFPGVDWLGLFKKRVFEFRDKFWTKPTDCRSIDEYAESMCWARGGATSWKLPHYVRAGKSSRPKKTKTAASVLIHPDKVKEVLRTFYRQHVTVVQKREAAKVRGVVNTNMEGFLQMDFLSQWTEAGFKGSDISTLFMHSRAHAAFWEQFLQNSKDYNLVKFPMDQSLFDHMIRLEMLACIFDAMKDMVDTEEASMVLDFVRRSVLDGGYVSVAGEEVRITRGIISGWRWTALFDTWVNYAETWAAVDIANILGYDVTFSGKFHGDDVNGKSCDEKSCIVISEIMDVCGFKINPSKVGIYRRMDEFLRNYADGEKVQGYLARTMLSIQWRNPVKEEPAKGDLRLSEAAGRWANVYRRGGSRRAVRNMMKVDLARGNGLPTRDIVRWLCTPIAAGGIESPMWYGDPVPPSEWLVPSRVIKSSHVEGQFWGIQLASSKLRVLGLTPSSRVVNDYVSAVLDSGGGSSGAQQEAGFEKPQLQRVNWKYRRKPENLLSAKVPVHPRWIKGAWPTWLVQACWVQAVEDRRYDLADSTLELEFRSASRYIRGAHGLNTWRDWCLGRLDLQTPQVGKFAPAYTAGKCRRIAMSWLSNALAGRKFRKPERLAMQWEFSWRVRVEMGRHGLDIRL